MGLSDDEVRAMFHEYYQPTWKLHRFTHPIWLVEYHFDEDGPTETEIEATFRYVGEYLQLTREEFAVRMDGCSGFLLGQPYIASQIEFLQSAGIRISLTEIPEGNHLICTEGQKYFLIESHALREEISAWMRGQGAAVETLCLE